MDRYGSDKPDIRFGMELVDLTDAVRDVDFRVFAEPIAAGGAVRGICAPGCAGYTRKQLDELTDLAVRHGAKGLVHLSVQPDGSFHGPAAKFLAGREAALLAATGAGAGRPHPDRRRCRSRSPAPRRSATSAWRWGIGWASASPASSPMCGSTASRCSSGSRRASAGTRPTTRSARRCPRMCRSLDTDPGAVRAQQYDLALNGWEMGGGSVRIHQRPLLEKAFGLMGHTIESMRDQFGALLDALEYGAPPHGGIAFGLDRWAALFAEVENIREVMAFPKTQSGADLMMDAPSPIAPEQLDELGLRVVND